MDDKDQAIREGMEKYLIASLKGIYKEFMYIGFESFYIHGIINLIEQGFVNDDGSFTDEYIRLAQQALEDKKGPKIITVRN
mgnify:CR=1 FL=1